MVNYLYLCIKALIVRQDGTSGSTTIIGPKISANLAMKVADIGVPQLAMHSCREMMCSQLRALKTKNMKLFCF